MELQIEKKQKSRKLGIYEFFEILQIEWIVADLRLRLYPKEKDKAYWKKVRDGKRKTIDEIADKNKLPTMFNDSSLKADMESRVFRESSFPDFHYKDANNEMSQSVYDLMYYYSKDADVRCTVLGETKVGKVKSFKSFEKFVTVAFKDDVELRLPISEVTRIL